eukprot:TRINITY_DN5552_c0_g1_i1.p1 TRINITY_DN5552_c0_g1~~TRINITY_DN5552_c0_g1_i1.p1  ORF type:complete len:783 (+),score=204.16 TRINITY_DN5552_c0_g1_i1:38-2386(+)
MRLLCTSLAVLASIALAKFTPIPLSKQVEDYVNTLGGSQPGNGDLSHGNTLPLIARPWGFNHWAPLSNTNGDGWWFRPDDYRFHGMRLTHQPSPWMGDWAHILFQAKLQDMSHADDQNYGSGYSAYHSSFSPFYFKANLVAFDNSPIEFTATRHGGIMRVEFPLKSAAAVDAGFDSRFRLSVQLPGGDITNITVGSDAVWMTGYSTQNGGSPSDYHLYFALGIYVGENGDQAPTQVQEKSIDGNYGYVDLYSNVPENCKITMRIGTSLISQDQAYLNLQREVGLKSFESLVAEARQEWHDRLSRVQIADVGDYPNAEDLKTVFYSALYRASLFPRQLSEIDANGNVVHWSPYAANGGVFKGPLSTDSGFWDAYVAVYPMNTLVNRDVLGPEMITGWLNAYQEGGWLPKWASPGYASSMVGTMADVSLSDAIVKNIPGFDKDLAYEAIRKDAFDLPPYGVNVGRVCLEDYLKYGYIPRGGSMTTGGSCYEVVSRSLNYMQSDWATAQAATVMGKTDDASVLSLRSKNYSLLFEKQSGFIRSRDVQTHFTTPFDEFAWGNDYTEGGPWQYRFYVPHDPEGLAAMYASANISVCDLLEQAMTMKSTFHIGGYGGEIHEQTEMPVNCWGQYEHNNQPAHYMLYMFQATDPQGIQGACAAKGMEYLRRAMTTLYKPTVEMFPGDEDNGEMSAWFVLSSLGLYELAPGSTDYTLGVPLFRKAVIALDGSKTLTIDAPNNGADNFYVQSVSWNGQVLTGYPLRSVKYSMLMEGGTLTFNMGPKPVAAVL